MTTTEQRAYSTGDPAALTAYREAVEQHRTFGKKIAAALEALGCGPRVYLRQGLVSGDRQRVTALEPKGDHVPEGWRLMKSSGMLEPRRGKPGEPARRWLAEHQPTDVRHVMEAHGLPRSCWLPGSRDFSYRISAPTLFEHEETLWAMFDAEPGASGSGFDDQKCTWTPRKLSEYHTAREAHEAVQTTAEVAA